MLILPVSSEPGSAASAQAQLKEVADQRVHCTLVVFGDTPHTRRVASRADVRAEGHPFRKVVWIPDPAVLAGVDTFGNLAAFAGVVDVVALTIRFEVSSTLDGDAAESFYKLELAFADALAGQVAP